MACRVFIKTSYVFLNMCWAVLWPVFGMSDTPVHGESLDGSPRVKPPPIREVPVCPRLCVVASYAAILCRLFPICIFSMYVYGMDCLMVDGWVWYEICMIMYLCIYVQVCYVLCVWYGLYLWCIGAYALYICMFACVSMICYLFTEPRLICVLYVCLSCLLIHFPGADRETTEGQP
jgi:hypothetical protein